MVTEMPVSSSGAAVGSVSVEGKEAMPDGWGVFFSVSGEGLLPAGVAVAGKSVGDVTL